MDLGLYNSCQHLLYLKIAIFKTGLFDSSTNQNVTLYRPLFKKKNELDN